MITMVLSLEGRHFGERASGTERRFLQIPVVKNEGAMRRIDGILGFNMRSQALGIKLLSNSVLSSFYSFTPALVLGFIIFISSADLRIKN